jgi:flagellin
MVAATAATRCRILPISRKVFADRSKAFRKAADLFLRSGKNVPAQKLNNCIEGLIMALVVNTNVSSIASQRHLMESRKDMETAMERLSSGKRINSSADDAAGLAIATRMDSQVRGLNMAIRNANDGISVVQSAEGAMQQVTEMLQRMRELAVQSTSGANNAVDRASLDQEVQQLKSEIDRIASSTTFNSKNLLDGSFAANIQVGYELGDTLAIGIGSVSTSALGIGSGAGSTGGAGVLISGRNSFAPTVVAGHPATIIHAGDIKINDVALGAFDATANAADVNGTGTNNNNIADFVDLVNDADAGVSASAFNRVAAGNLGTGIIAENQLSIKVGAVGSTPAVEAIIGTSSSMAEMVSNINLAIGGSVQASLDDGGRLVLSNSTGASISIADTSGTVGARDGGTGFTVDDPGTTGADANIVGGLTAINYNDNNFNGFLRLDSTNGQDISIQRGNDGLIAPGTLADLEDVGFREITESPTGQPYTITGTSLDSAGIAGTIAKGDITLNGVEIYEASLTANSDSFQGKLDLINAFQTETNVVASAYFEKTFDFSNVTFVADMTFDINGTQVAYSSTMVDTVANINGATSVTGVVASINGNNVKLVGTNVQNITIDNFDYDLNDTFEAEVGGKNHSSLSGGTNRTVFFGNLNYTAGMALTLHFESGGYIGNTGGGADSHIFTAGASSFTYTVQSGDSQADVAIGFRDLMMSFLQSGDSLNAYAGESVGMFFSARSVSVGGTGALMFKTGLSIGSAAIRFSVTLPTDATKAFSASTTNYGSIRLSSLNDSPISIDLGSNASANEHGLLEMNVGAADYDTIAPSMGNMVLVSGLSVSSASGAESALTVLDQAIIQVGINRSSLGAIENRLDHTISNLSNVVENTEAAKSRIQDADFALESAQLARAQILQQAGTAMLAQANAAPQNVLSLLG